MFILLALLLIASFLRFWQLDTFPPGLYHDEAYNGLDALSLTRGVTFPQFYEGWELYSADAHAERPPTPTRFPIFFEGNYGREPLHVYLMALSVALFGPTPFAVRAVPAAAGVLAVLTTYLAATALVQSRDWRAEINSRQSPISNPQSLIPLFAAATVAVLYPAVHFSRFGIRAMLFVPIEGLVVYAFWRGIGVEKGQREWVWFGVAGFFLGLGLYSFAASRLFPLLFVVFVPLWLGRDRSKWQRYWRQIGMMASVSLLTVAPLLLFFWRYPYFFIFRIAFVSNKGAGAVEGRPFLTWLLNIGRVFRGLYWQGETHLRHNLPGRPFFDLIQATLFTVGVSQTIRHWQQPRQLFLLLWFLIMLLPSILSGDAPHFGRLSGAIPAAAILIAYGLVTLTNWLTNRLPGEALRTNTTDHRLLFTFYCLLFTISLILTTRDYFYRYAAEPQLTADFQLGDFQLGRYGASQPPETNLYLTPAQEEMATIYFALADPTRLRSYNGATGLIPAGRPDEPSLYLVRPEDTESLNSLTSFFPDGSARETHENFVPFGVTAVSSHIQPQNQANHPFADIITLLGWSQTETGDQLTLTLYWQANADMERDYTAFVHLFGPDGVPVAQLDRPPAGYPTSDWHVGEVVVDQYVVALPEGIKTADFGLRTGFYYLPTLEPLGEPFLISPSP